MSAVRSKVRIYDLAKDLKIDTKRLIEDVRREGVDVSVPSNAISKEVADKIRDNYFPNKNTSVKRKIKLLYKPFQGPVPIGNSLERKTSATQRPKKRICPLCGIHCMSRAELRSHLVSHHMNEVMVGKVLCRVSADELCRATGADLKTLTGIAIYMGCTIRNGPNYIPPMLVKEVVRRIRIFGPSRNNSDINVGWESRPIDSQDHLDCPVTGNAIYVFGEDWKSLSRLTKSALLNSRRRDCNRIIHNGEWFSRLKSLLSTRELRADLRRHQRVSPA